MAWAELERNIMFDYLSILNDCANHNDSPDALINLLLCADVDLKTVLAKIILAFIKEIDCHLLRACFLLLILCDSHDSL